MINDHATYPWTASSPTIDGTQGVYALPRLADNTIHRADPIFVSQSTRDKLEAFLGSALSSDFPKVKRARMDRSAQVAPSTATSSPRTQQHRPTMRAPHRRGQGPR